MARNKALFVIAAAALAVPAIAEAQTQGSSGQARFQSGYGNARGQTAGAATGSTRDENGNRLIVDGLIQSGAGSYSRQSGGVSSRYGGSGSGGIAGSTAIGNNLNVVVQGNWNTVIVNSRQTNTGDITAGTALNGKIDLDD